MLPTKKAKCQSLSKNILTVIFDIAGIKEWLRMRQVSKQFDEAAYSMKNYQLQSAHEKVTKFKERIEVLLESGLRDQI